MAVEACDHAFETYVGKRCIISNAYFESRITYCYDDTMSRLHHSSRPLQLIPSVPRCVYRQRWLQRCAESFRSIFVPHRACKYDLLATDPLTGVLKADADVDAATTSGQHRLKGYNAVPLEAACQSTDPCGEQQLSRSPRRPSGCTPSACSRPASSGSPCRGPWQRAHS